MGTWEERRETCERKDTKKYKGAEEENQEPSLVHLCDSYCRQVCVEKDDKSAFLVLMMMLTILNTTIS